MIEQKKNDWLATLFYSPEKTLQDLADLGITTKNSSLQDIEYYKKLPQIQEAFKQEDGSFDDKNFTKYYQEALTLYNKADEENLIGDITNYYSYDSYDYLAPIGSKVRNTESSLVSIINPSRRSQGVYNLKQFGAPTMSYREVGQRNRVFNWETQEFEDWTPNDWGGLKAITRPTLVMAQWDEDGTHEVNGRIVAHQKGEYKFNENGDPYYETLGDRDVAGKDILHISDTFTVDGSTLNRYDFFDSDSLKKSTGGVVAKTLFKVAPMFIPHVGTTYGLVTAAMELGKLLPVLYKSIEGIASGDTNSDSRKTANNIQAWFSRFDSSLTDYGKSGFFTFENIGNLVESSSAQLFQQRNIAEIPAIISKLTHNGAITENAMKWGRGLSLFYMTGTSSTDAYNIFKEAGASDRVAGLGMLAVMGSMGSLMSSDYFRDFWYKGSYLDRTKLKQVIKEAASDITKREFAENATKKEAANWILRTQKAITDRIANMKPGDLLSDSINEGVEETMEEVSIDAVKALFFGLNSLGIVDKEVSYDFHMTPEDILSRYFTSFVGGSIGGAVFSLHNKFIDRNNPSINRAIKDGDKGLQELIYLIREGDVDNIKKELTRFYKDGKLGSTSLSGTELELVKTEEGKKFQYKPAEEGNSQNDLIYRQLNNYVDRINEVLQEEGLDLSDDDLAIISVLQEHHNLSFEDAKEHYREIAKASQWEQIEKALIEDKYYSQIFEDWNTLSKDIIQTKVAMENMLTPGDNESKTPKDIEEKITAMQNNTEYQQLRTKLDRLRAEKNSILNGERNDFYLSQLLFASKPILYSAFIPNFGIHNYTLYKHGKDYSTLNEEDKAKINEEYNNFINTKGKSQIINAHKLFYDFQEKLSGTIVDSANKSADLSKVFIPGMSEFAQDIEATQKLIAEDQEALDKAILELPEGQDTSEEIIRLRSSIADLQNYLNNKQNFQKTIFQPALTKEGKEKFNRQNNSLDYLHDYSTSYLSFLNYLKNNGMYLNLVDGDLYSILSLYTSQFKANNNILKEIQQRINEGALDIDPVLIDDISKDIINFIEVINSSDITEIVKKYNDLKSKEWAYTLEDIYDISFDTIINQVLPMLGGKPFIGFIDEVSKLKEEMISPIFNLLEKASSISNLGDLTVIDLIRKEQTDLINSKNLEDYIIKNKESLNKLKETMNLIDVVVAAVNTSTGSHNSSINTFRKSLGKELLSEIDDDKALNLTRELNNLKGQISLLLEISSQNLVQKLNEDRDIRINIRTKFIEILSDKGSLIVDKFKNAFGIDTVALAKEYNITKITKPEEFNDFEKNAIAFETELFKLVYDKGLSSQEIADKLLSCFEIEEIEKLTPSKLSRDPNTKLTDYDKLVYLASILSYPSQNFYNELNKVVSDPNYKLAPVFSQECANRIAYSFIKDNGIFRNIILRLKETTKEYDDLYQKTLAPFYNIVTIYGGAGTGKTEGVASTLAKMIPDAYIMTCAITPKQVDKLNNSIGKYDQKFTKNELIKQIIGRELTSEDIVPIKQDEHVITYTMDPDIHKLISTKNIFGTNKNRILFIDEISLFDRVELALISRWAVANNIKVVALGDYIQNSSERLVGNTLVSSGLEDGFVIKSPDLIAPLRPDNIAKYDNYIKLRTILTSAYEAIYKDTDRSIEKVREYVNKYITEHKIEFKYFEDPNTFGGTKIISSNSINEEIVKLKKLSNNIAIISDTPAKYISTGITVFDSKTIVQGDEFDYMIIDKPFGKDNNNKFRSNYDKLKDIYTLTQRTKKGTIIIRRELSNQITSHNDPTSSGNLELDESQINTFKEWRLSALSGLSSDVIKWEREETSYVPSATSLKTVNTVTIQTPTEQNISGSTASNITDTLSETRERESTPIETVSNRFTSTIPHIQPTVDEVEEADEIKEEIPSISQQTKTSPVTRILSVPALPNEEVSSAEDFLGFLDNIDNINKYSINRNIIKLIKTNNPAQLKRALYLLRSFYVNEHYKKEWEPLVIRGLVTKYVGNEDLIAPILNIIYAKEFKFVFIPYNGKGLLVARVTLSNEAKEEVDIPLLSTNYTSGEYLGNIILNSDIKLDHYKDKTATPIDIINFKQDQRSNDGLFITHTEPVILSISKEQRTEFSDDQNDFINSSNGNTFLIISTDPFKTEQDFKDFLNPTKATFDSNAGFSYTTQHDDLITLQGMNWTGDFQEFFEYSKQFLYKDKPHSIINVQRAGTILAIAYNTPDLYTENSIEKNEAIKIKNLIEQAIQYRLEENYNNKSNVVFINDKPISDFNEAMLLLNKEKPNSIYFGVKNADGNSIPDQNGEYTLNKVFYDIKDKVPKLSSIQINIITKACDNSSIFKNGIYGRDLTKSLINGVYYSVQNYNHSYTTNLSKIVGNDYKIDVTKIVPSSEENIFTEDRIIIDNINKQLKQFDLNYHVSDLSTLQTTIDTINKDIMSKVSTPEFNIFVYKEGLLEKRTMVDPRYMVANTLEISDIDNIKFPEKYSLQFAPFLVSLGDKNQGYVLETNKVRSYPIYNEYKKLREYLTINRELIINNPNIYNYVNSLLKNEDINLETAEKYYEEYNNLGLAELQQKINEFLIAKLENGEC